MNPSILVILVNYFNEKETASFIKYQLMRQSFQDIAVVVVNNGCNDESLLIKMASEHPNVFLLKSESNLGYLGGSHYGLEMYLKLKPGIPDGIIISNSDLEFMEDGLIEKLHTKYARNSSDTGVVGTTIYSPETGVNQNPFAKTKIKKNKLKFLKIIFSNYLIYMAYEMVSVFKRKITAKVAKPLSSGKVETVYAVHGAFFLLTKEFFKRGGTLNFPSFLFGEEIFIAEQAKSMGMKVCFDDSLEIVHHEHHTTGVVKSKVLVKYMHDSVSYLLKTYYQ